jgi:hypothetical protein
MPYMQLFPLDDQALETHRPPHETKWSRLENVIVRDGVIANRPGFVMVNWDGNDPDMPLGWQ